VSAVKQPAEFELPPLRRPAREHLGRGVRPHRARRHDDQHDAHAECRPHIERGDHKGLYRFSLDDYKELVDEIREMAASLRQRAGLAG